MSMKDNEYKIKIKVVSGYILVVLITVAAMWWVYAKVVSITASADYEQGQMYEKSTLTSSVISYLYQVDYYGNRLTQSYSDKALGEYCGALETLYARIDSLRTKIDSQHQTELIDQLLILLKQKDKTTLELTRIHFNISNNDFYERSLEGVIRHSTQDSVEHIVVTSVVINDTIKSLPVSKRSLFQRIGDVFSPNNAPQENAQIVASVKTDTLRSKQLPSDSLAFALQKAQEDITISRTKIRQTVASKLHKLIATEQLISAQIALIITELNHEATQSNVAEITARGEALQSSGRVIAVVAVVAVLIIALFLFFILKDIGRSARYKRELEAARIRAEELMRSRHSMLLNISHDIKAPLCSITGYLDLMECSSDVNVHKWSESMKISASYIMTLLTNLLEYARLEAGKSVAHISAFDIDAMVDDIIRIFTPLARDKGLDLANDNSTKVGFIASDAIRMRQIVMNLTSNAIKFTEHGNVKIDYALCDDNMLVVTVSDSGRGIAESKLTTIFDEFTTDANTEAIEGSGLGLAVVRGAVVLLGGTISVESKQLHGSTFTISIPVKRADEQSQYASEIITPLNIMIVDDDALQLRMMSEMMSHSGHTLHCTSKLKEATKILALEKIDLVLTDLQMGALSGYKLLREIRAQGYSMPVVAVSASERANTAELKKAGFSDFLCKPFSLAKLNATVAQSAPGAGIPSINELMGGDQDAVREIMDLFIDATTENLGLLKTFLANGRPDDIRRLCHKMLPMFLQLQFSEIAQLLKDVDSGNFDRGTILQIITLTENVIAQYRTV